MRPGLKIVLQSYCGLAARRTALVLTVRVRWASGQQANSMKLNTEVVRACEVSNLRDALNPLRDMRLQGGDQGRTNFGIARNDMARFKPFVIATNISDKTARFSN